MTHRLTGTLFVTSAVAFAGAASVLSATFDWPDILREPPATVLIKFADGGDGLVWIWFASAWTYALLLVPMLLLPRVITHPALRVATWIGAASVVLSLIGFLRWVFVVPPLAAAYASGSDPTKAAVEAAWIAQHQFGGALLGEHLGQLFAIAWSVTVSLLLLRSAPILGSAGLLASALYLLNQGDVLATAIPDFPVWDAAGFAGSTAWGLWIAALGVTLLLRRHTSVAGIRATQGPRGLRASRSRFGE